MEYSLFSRDSEEQGQIDACKELGMAMMAYAVLGRGMLSAEVPKIEELASDDVRAELPRFHSANVEKNLRLRSALETIARRKNATLTQLSIAWPMAQDSRAGAFIVPIPGAKSRKHLEENVRAADIVLTADDLAEIDRIVPPGSASGTAIARRGGDRARRRAELGIGGRARLRYRPARRQCCGAGKPRRAGNQ
jgi:aryl-alcohol dehydrogenase-like predicted oxidoreductase